GHLLQARRARRPHRRTRRATCGNHRGHPSTRRTRSARKPPPHRLQAFVRLTLRALRPLDLRPSTFLNMSVQFIALLTLLTPLGSAVFIALFLRKQGALASLVSTLAAAVVASGAIMLA